MSGLRFLFALLGALLAFLVLVGVAFGSFAVVKIVALAVLLVTVALLVGP